MEADLLLRPRAAGARRCKAWGGKSENVAAGQRAFTHRAKMNGVAALGKWSETAREGGVGDGFSLSLECGERGPPVKSEPPFRPNGAG